MEAAKDSLIDLERHRQRLEQTIKEVKDSLQYWQSLDSEYESLKEEVEAVEDDDPAALAQIQSSFEGEAISQKNLAEIFGPKSSRSKEQIVNVLDRRIDYVTKNIESLTKQLEIAENKHAAAQVISQPDMRDEEGQPITEIMEELDEDGNVLSYKLSRPGETLPQVRAALQKAGIKDLPEVNDEVPVDGDSKQSKQNATASSNSKPVTAEDATPAVTKLPSAQEQTIPVRPHPKRPAAKDSKAGANQHPEKPAKKGVSFAEDTKPAAEEDLPPISRNAIRVESIMKSAKEQEDFAQQEPTIPEDEDHEEAELRRQMLDYSMGGMGEIGAVVAELDIEEASDEDEDWDYSDEGFDEEEEDEDKYGRYTGRVVTDKYRERMLELERKLGIKSGFTENLEKKDKEDGSDDSGGEDERLGRIVVKTEASASPSGSQPPPAKPALKGKRPSDDSAKKGVRFATSLDIAPDSPPAAVSPAVTSDVLERAPVVEPVSDIVVERTSNTRAEEPKPARKASKFKKARGSAPQVGGLPKGPMDVPARFFGEDRPTAPTGPQGTTLADTLVEHDAVRPVDDVEFETYDDQQELANEHQRLRRKFINREGGFLKEDENPLQPLDETEGGPPRLSRFKAARLSKQ
ncbi:Prefoldin subunit-domain-containing protein [Emericellopsis atlantica]|uniref:Prefoldin subunit-domain-containing protein n=1 Tax=Emericellopsis atlantica TaxID=2614577 RepID=A0A9P8CQS0_9HYPO|nr:Prefoldin subunit-domain-containing protein [Emericellopsis atlantica]KAG9255943.1 Prefoldin subunit-domain-containing protein [Emericellopsis atlantica]